eukprot:6187042-Pleurochrysis_carterae.AAC.3
MRAGTTLESELAKTREQCAEHVHATSPGTTSNPHNLCAPTSTPHSPLSSEESRFGLHQPPHPSAPSACASSRFGRCCFSAAASPSLVELCDCTLAAGHGRVFRDARGALLRRGDRLVRVAHGKRPHHGVFYGGAHGSDIAHLVKMSRVAHDDAATAPSTKGFQSAESTNRFILNDQHMADAPDGHAEDKPMNSMARSTCTTRPAGLTPTASLAADGSLGASL